MDRNHHRDDLGDWADLLAAVAGNSDFLRLCTESKQAGNQLPAHLYRTVLAEAAGASQSPLRPISKRGKRVSRSHVHAGYRDNAIDNVQAFPAVDAAASS
jgi:hypothetical protein